MRPNVIPSPQEIILPEERAKLYTRDRVYNICPLGNGSKKLTFGLNYLKRNLHEQFGIHSNIAAQSEGLDENDILLCTDRSLAESIGSYSIESGIDADFFDNPNAAEQGYVMQSSPGKPVLLYAQTDQGCLYAVTTLLQLFYEDGGQVILESVQMKDYPEFLLRGNKWTIWCELGVWSYDWGDGIEAFRKRTIKKLDMLLQYKINMVIFDGLGWDTDIFPEYRTLMNDLNKEARLRGISLIHTGQSSGFCFKRNMIDAGIYRGEVLENRKSYPGGEKYRCIGEQIYAGTCLTNETLINRNLKSIRDFVEGVEPGALYVHQLDVLGLPQSMWESRCTDCRKKWPNDRLDAEDGMAGAYAEYYDQIVTYIKQVKTSDYNADADCIIMLISPGYLDAVLVEDEEWRLALKYWSMVSGLMKNKENVCLGFREMFFNRENNGRRISELKAAVNDAGNGHCLGIIHFYGGDGWQSENLFLTTPVLNSIFTGADMLITASGHAFQEPQQLLNAECMWNPLHSPYCLDIEQPDNFPDFLALYNKSRTGGLRPNLIYGDGGFLEIACKKLYGNTVGAEMAKVFGLRGETGKPPIPYLRSKELKTTPGPDGALEGYIDFAETKSLSEIVTAKKIYSELLRTTLKAQSILDGVIKTATIKKERYEEIDSFREFMGKGVEYLGYLTGYVEIYKKLIELENAGNEKGNADKQKGNSKANDLENEFLKLRERVDSAEAQNGKSCRVPVDYLDGALAGRSIILRFLQNNLNLMADHIQRGHMQ